MPWNAGQGKFIRANPDFSGETVWQQDQQATIKIIASRHDSHDQDLADGISACLNLDGITSMRADLDLNSNKLINVATGTAPTDGVNKAQLDTQDTDLRDYIDAGDQANDAYTDQAVADARVDSMSWLPASNTVRVNRGDGTNAGVAISQFDQPVTFNGNVTMAGTLSTPSVVTTADLRAVDIRSNGPITHKSEAFAAGALVTLQALDSSRWTLAHDGATTLNFQAPTGADPYLGEDYEVEGSVLVTNGAAPGTITLQLNGSNVSAQNILGANSTVASDKYLLSYVIHRSVGDAYDFLFIWSVAP